MKKCILILGNLLLLTGCFNDPLFSIRRLARSNDIEKKQQASSDYKRVIETLAQAYSSYAGINKEVGRLLMLENQYKPALEHLKASVEIRNNDSELYYWIGVCYANLSLIEKNESYQYEAKYHYEIALNLTPNNKAYLYSYAQLLVFGTEEYEKAENVLYKYVYELKTPDIDGFMLLGRTYYMLGFNSDNNDLRKEYYGKAYNVYQELYEKKKQLSKVQVLQLEEAIKQTGDNLKQ